MADDFISTDIDKIINILKTRGKVSLNDLAKESNISASLLERWLPILEEEGLIDISYHLTRVYISWTGEKEIIQSGKIPIDQTTYPVDISPEQYEYPVHRDIELPDDELSVKTEKKKEDRLRKMPSSVSIKRKELPSSKEEETIGQFELPKDIKSEFEINSRQITTRAEALKKLNPDINLPGEVSTISVDKTKNKEIQIKPLIFNVEEPRKTKLDARAQKIKQYMEDVNKARDELEKLKVEKRKLFRETYEPIEKKFTSELETISDKISEKEERILQLQQKVLMLPGVIEEVDRQQLKLKEIEEEARKTFDDASIAINESLGDLSVLEQQALEQMKIARENINLGVDESEEINSILTKIGNLELEVREKLNSAKKRLEEEQVRVNSLETSLEKLENIRTTAAHKVEDVVSSVETQKQRIMDLQKEITKIGEIQNWVRKHKEEYGHLIDEFGEQIKENEVEYNKLREAIETNFVRRYVEDLDEVSKGYEFELNKAQEAEENIDTKIELTKQRISDLLRKSREIVEVFESSEKEAPIEINIETLQNNESQLLKKVQNREEEREQILEVLKGISSNEPKYTKLELKEKPKEKKPKIKTYSEFLSEKRSEGLDMKQISRAWKKYKKEHGI
ncbi:hypothetical protein KO317_03915 [Candidatus Micrarchaeota archaeon]|nr:hypothetical protein [Candidatus Micrarchaeota archaeon]